MLWDLPSSAPSADARPAEAALIPAPIAALGTEPPSCDQSLAGWARGAILRLLRRRPKAIKVCTEGGRSRHCRHDDCADRGCTKAGPTAHADSSEWLGGPGMCMFAHLI
jgi:hypothetical protein